MTAYRYAYCRQNGQITISREYEEWGDCYEDYCQEMMVLSTREDLSSYQWRGVWEKDDMRKLLDAVLWSLDHVAFNTVTEG